MPAGGSARLHLGRQGARCRTGGQYSQIAALNLPAEAFAQQMNGNGQMNRAQAAARGDERGCPRGAPVPGVMSAPPLGNHTANRYMPGRPRRHLQNPCRPDTRRGRNPPRTRAAVAGDPYHVRPSWRSERAGHTSPRRPRLPRTHCAFCNHSPAMSTDDAATFCLTVVIWTALRVVLPGKPGDPMPKTREQWSAVLDWQPLPPVWTD